MIRGNELAQIPSGKEVLEIVHGPEKKINQLKIGLIPVGEIEGGLVKEDISSLTFDNAETEQIMKVWSNQPGFGLFKSKDGQHVIKSQSEELTTYFVFESKVFGTKQKALIFYNDEVFIGNGEQAISIRDICPRPEITSLCFDSIVGSTAMTDFRALAELNEVVLGPISDEDNLDSLLHEASHLWAYDLKIDKKTQYQREARNTDYSEIKTIMETDKQGFEEISWSERVANTCGRIIARQINKTGFRVNGRELQFSRVTREKKLTSYDRYHWEILKQAKLDDPRRYMASREYRTRKD